MANTDCYCIHPQFFTCHAADCYLMFFSTQCAGPLLHYLNGEPVKDDQAWKSNVLHVHEKCTEWYVPCKF
jgi:hypothetical protein